MVDLSSSLSSDCRQILGENSLVEKRFLGNYLRLNFAICARMKSGPVKKLFYNFCY